MRLGWRKVYRDMAHNKLRTALVVLSVAVGVFALGFVRAVSDEISHRMSEAHRSTRPAHISFGGGPFDQEAAKAAMSEMGIVDAEGETLATFRWKMHGDSDWRVGSLVARADFPGQRLNRSRLVLGLWPAEGALAIERQSAIQFGLGVKDDIAIEYGQREKWVPVEGVVWSPSVSPPQFGGDPTFYATPETLAWIAGEGAPNRLYLAMSSFSTERAEQSARRVKDRLESMGLFVAGYQIADPDVHPLQSMVDTMTLILLVLGALSLGLSAFLIINTTRAIVIQQIWQIGVMKVYGASVADVVRIYLIGALAYGGMAALIAVPAAAVSAQWVSRWLLGLINLTGDGFRIAAGAALLQVVISLVLPALASLGPVLRGARTTPREAMTSYGLGDQSNQMPSRNWLGRLHWVPRPLALSLRGAFRRKTRLLLTIFTLIVAGIMFLSVQSVGTSLQKTLETLVDELGLDVWVVFEKPERSERLIEVATSIPGVEHAEVWDQRGARLALPRGQEAEIYVMGVPPDSVMYAPNMASGRPLTLEDGHAILLNQRIAVEHGFRVGDEVELTIDRRTSVWTVVGTVVSITNEQRDCFVPLSVLTRETGTFNHGTVVMVQTSTANVQGLMRSMRETFTKRGLTPSFLLSAQELREQNRAQFQIIVALMLVMAILAAGVGSLGLMGTMSITVLERSREIGVMRAIGASSLAVTGIFLSEGLLVGLLSWLISVPLSYPSAMVFGRLVGNALFHVPLEITYQATGVVLWLVCVIVLSSLASLFPSLRAARLRVVQVLRFE